MLVHVYDAQNVKNIFDEYIPTSIIICNTVIMKGCFLIQVSLSKNAMISLNLFFTLNTALSVYKPINDQNFQNLGPMLRLHLTLASQVKISIKKLCTGKCRLQKNMNKINLYTVSNYYNLFFILFLLC